MKRLFTIFGLLTLIGLSGVLQAQVPTNGLVGYWPFIGNANDASGNGNNGNVYGATLTTDRFGNINNAYYFSNRHFIRIPHAAEFEFGTNHDFTYSIWIKPNIPSSAWSVFLTTSCPDGLGYGGFQAGVANSSFHLEQTGINQPINANLNFNDNNWHNIVLVFDRTSDIISLYHNGVYVSNVSTPATQTFPGVCYPGILIGASRDQQLTDTLANPSYCYFGSADDLRLYNRKLQPTEILELFNEVLFTEINSIFTGVYYGEVQWGDYDQDSDLDALVSGYQSYNVNTSGIAKIYRNDGNDVFTDINATFNMTGGYIERASWADVDNDSDLDVALNYRDNSSTSSQKHIKVFKNLGSNSFTDIGVTLQGGANPTIAWGDYNKDGYKDLFIQGDGSYAAYFAKVYRNNGNYTFTDISAGLFGEMCVNSAAWGDYDNDTYPDLFYGGYAGGTPAATKLYRNVNGTNTFTSIPWTNPGAGPSTWIDYNNDNFADLISGSWNGDSARIWKNNNGNGTFSPTSNAFLVMHVSDNGCVISADYDNDGFQDVFITGGNGGYRSDLYKNNSATAFTQVSSTGIIPLTYSDASFGDYNGDGLPDILISGWDGTSVVTKIYKNTSTIVAPSIQATNITFSNIQPNQFSLKWSDGTGSSRAVFIKQDSVGTSSPVNNTTYNANTTFGSGTQIGTSGWYCVFNGTSHASGVTVTNLLPNTNYRVMVCEYSGAAGIEQYNSSTAFNNPKTQKSCNVWGLVKTIVSNRNLSANLACTEDLIFIQKAANDSMLVYDIITGNMIHTQKISISWSGGPAFTIKNSRLYYGRGMNVLRSYDISDINNWIALDSVTGLAEGFLRFWANDNNLLAWGKHWASQYQMIDISSTPMSLKCNVGTGGNNYMGARYGDYIYVANAYQQNTRINISDPTNCLVSNFGGTKSVSIYSTNSGFLVNREGYSNPMKNTIYNQSNVKTGEVLQTNNELLYVLPDNFCLTYNPSANNIQLYDISDGTFNNLIKILCSKNGSFTHNSNYLIRVISDTIEFYQRNCTLPPIQASNITFSDVQTNLFSFNWTDGNFSNRAVFIKQDSVGTSSPVNNTTYNASTTFGSGTQIGTSGWYCVFNGSTHASGVTVTNLLPNTKYRVMVCEYNGVSGSEQYNIASATNNPRNQITSFCGNWIGNDTTLFVSSVNVVNPKKMVDNDTTSYGSIDITHHTGKVGEVYYNFPQPKLVNIVKFKFEKPAASYVAQNFTVRIYYRSLTDSSWIQVTHNNDVTIPWTTSAGTIVDTIAPIFAKDWKIEPFGWWWWTNNIQFKIFGVNFHAQDVSNIGQAILGPSTVYFGQPGVTFSIPPIAGVTSYEWHFPSGATITSGATSNTVQVNFASNARSGNIIVIGKSSNCSYQAVSKPFRLIVKMPSNTLIAKYLFNGNANDISGNSLNGIVYGATLTTDRYGNANSAYNFNGTSQYIAVPHNSLLNFSRQLTISAWIKPVNFATHQTIIAKQTDLSSNIASFRMVIGDDINNPNGLQAFLLTPMGTGEKTTRYYDWAYQSNSWIHVAFVYSGSQMNLYVNGRLKLTNTEIDQDSIVNNNNELRIGKLADNWTYYFNGAIDDIYIFNGALTDGEIYNLYTDIPTNQATNITFSNIQPNQFSFNWSDGNGSNRAVFVKQDTVGTAIPVNNTTYAANTSFGSGSQIGTSDWYCVFNGTSHALGVTVTNLLPNTNYRVMVCEYSGNPGVEQYNILSSANNPKNQKTFPCSPTFTKQSDIPLTAVNYGNHECANFVDVDNDGLLDLFITGSLTTTGSSGFTGIYKNNGNNTFASILGLPFGSLFGSEGDWGDFNNDGYLDLLLTAETNSFQTGWTKIYKNNGNSTFTEVFSVNKGLAAAWGDYNNDGKLDFAIGEGLVSSSAYTLNIFRNTDNNSFVIDQSLVFPSTTHGYSRIQWIDFNNDGYSDIIAIRSDSALLYYNSGNGSFSKINAFNIPVSGGSTSLVYTDYNKDGYIDIFKSDGNVYINQNGTGSFIPEVLNNMPCYLGGNDWGDFNNDGNPDMLLSGNEGCLGNSPQKTKIFRNDELNVFTDIAAGITGIASWSSVKWGDYNNDGYLDFLIDGYSDYTGYKCSELYKSNGGCIPNTPPVSPVNLVSSVTGNAILLKWQRPSDNQSNTMSLTYNVRIGTSSGGVDILSPMANTVTGWRRIPFAGNAFQDTLMILKNLAPGTYYWSVQAIDNGYMGGSFAAEQSFTICPMESPTITGNDTVCFGGAESYMTELGKLNYSWIVSPGGSIVAGMSTNSITVQWNSPGSQTISVGYTSAAGCPVSNTTTFPVTVHDIPSAPGSINGLDAVCKGASGIVYSIPEIQNATSYAWTLPTGVTIDAGAGTNSITVSFPNIVFSGVFSVYGKNICYDGLRSPGLKVKTYPPLNGQIALNDITITGFQEECFSAQTITTGGNGEIFRVEPGGTITLIASERINLLPGSTVQQGGYLHAYITTQCLACSALKISGTDSIANEKQSTFNIYPNPTSGNFTLEMEGETEVEIVRVEIYNMRGEKLLTEEMIGEHRHLFSLSDRPVGIYFIRVISESGVNTLKVVRN